MAKKPLDIIDGSREWVLEHILSNVQHNGWVKSWGERPSDVDNAITLARKVYFTSPILIPIFAHRFIPSDPCEAGNPIFSVWGLDTICYGKDLATYFRVELGILPYSDETVSFTRKIRYWHDVWYYNNFPEGR